MKVRRNSGAQQLQDHVTKFSQHCRACVSCSRPTREIFAQNLATLCALCAAGTRCSGSKIRPGAALLHCERYCVREERALLHSWARQCTLCGTVRCGAERCAERRAERCAGLCSRLLLTAAAHQRRPCSSRLPDPDTRPAAVLTSPLAVHDCLRSFSSVRSREVLVVLKLGSSKKAQVGCRQGASAV